MSIDLEEIKSKHAKNKTSLKFHRLFLFVDDFVVFYPYLIFKTVTWHCVIEFLHHHNIVSNCVQKKHFATWCVISWDG